MKQRKNSKLIRRIRGILPTVALALSGAAQAQTCLTAGDLDDATRTAVINAARHDFDLLSRGDAASLRAASIMSLAENFAGIEALIAENKPSLSGAQATARPPYMLKAEKQNASSSSTASGEFLCGVFGANGQTANSAEFILPNLPAGNYAIVLLDVALKTPSVTTFVLEQQGTDWKLAGLYVKSSRVAGHDVTWYAEKARAFKAKGETHNAWLYFLEARDLAVPVQFMSTQMSDRLYEESQAMKPADLPDANPVDLSVGATKYKITALFPTAVGEDLDLVVKYQSADVSNTAKTFQENEVVLKAMLVKYPEFRDAFAGVVVRAVEPSGKDYGSLTAMKDVK